CSAVGAAYFFKQWGAFAPHGVGQAATNGRHGPLTLVAPDGARYRAGGEAPAGPVLMARYGQSRAGRSIAGGSVDAYPPAGGPGRGRPGRRGAGGRAMTLPGAAAAAAMCLCGDLDVRHRGGVRAGVAVRTSCKDCGCDGFTACEPGPVSPVPATAANDAETP